MHVPTLQNKASIRNPHGFHLRPIQDFVLLARSFQSTVAVIKDGRRVDGKSYWEMFSMVSPPGTELTLEVSGPDADQALKALVDAIENPVYHYDPEPPLPPKG
jgi:phosphocarrier protein